MEAAVKIQDSSTNNSSPKLKLVTQSTDSNSNLYTCNNSVMSNCHYNATNVDAEIHVGVTAPPVTVSEDDIICDFNNIAIAKPSTSGVHNTPMKNLHKVKCLKSEIESSDEDDHSQYEAVLQTYSDVSVSRERPSSLALSYPRNKRRVLRISPEEISSPDSPTNDDEINKYLSPDTDSQEDMENSIIDQLNDGEKPSVIPELSLEEERSDLKNWKACTIGGIKRQIDMKVIEPYKRVLSHGGYLTTGSHNAIITFSACFLPHKSRVDYNYVMDNLFFYVLHTLNQLVTDDYVLVYLHGGTAKDCIPTFSWLKRCYQMIDRKLKKNLKALYLVHPTFWLKTLVIMIKPFISSKFSRKMHFINSLTELYDKLPIEEASIPDKVKQYDRIKLSMLHKQQ